MATITFKKGAGFEPRPEGIYKFLVEDVEEKESKNPKYGNYLNWHLKILEDEDNEGEYVGESLWHITPLVIPPNPKSKHWNMVCAIAPELREAEDSDEPVEYDTKDFIKGEFYAEVEIVKRKNSDDEKNDFARVWSVEEYEEYLDDMSKKAEALKKRRQSARGSNEDKTDASQKEQEAKGAEQEGKTPVRKKLNVGSKSGTGSTKRRLVRGGKTEESGGDVDEENLDLPIDDDEQV